MQTQPAVACFSMEIALEEGMPTYSGGLGVLAGDMLRSAPDLKVPMVGIGLLHRKGYFHQRLDASGWQREEPVEWPVNDFVVEMPARVTVTVNGHAVQLRAWQYEVKGGDGFAVPVFLLDANLPGNAEWDRTLTHYLYGGDQYYPHLNSYMISNPTLLARITRKELEQLLCGYGWTPIDKALLAMDANNPTCNGRCAKLGIPQTVETWRAYRELIVTTPGLRKCISGAILYDETIR